MARKKTSVTLDESTLKWIQTKIREKRFRSVSHAVEYALERLRRKEA